MSSETVSGALCSELMLRRSDRIAPSASCRVGNRSTVPMTDLRYLRSPLISSYQRKTQASGPVLRFSLNRLPSWNRLMQISLHERRWLNLCYAPGAVFGPGYVAQTSQEFPL